MTNAKPGTENELLNILWAEFPGEAENTYVVCKGDQQVALAGIGSRLRVLPASAHYSQIAGFIQREFVDGVLAKSGPETHLTVLSFHPAVLRLRAFLATEMQTRVDSIHWGRLLKSRGSPGGGVPYGAATALANLLSEEEVLECVRRALSGAKAMDENSGIRMSDIRIYLEREEPRLKKTNYRANVPGIIGAAIDLAVRRGIAVAARNIHPINPPIWLRVPTSTLKSAGIVNAVGPGTGSTEGTWLTLPTTPARPVFVDADQVVQRGGGEDSAATDADSDQIVVVERPEASPMVRARTPSDDFVDALKDLGLGPFSRVREALYDSLERVVNEEAKKDMRSAISSAVKRAESVVPVANGEKPIPWRKVRLFLSNLLSRRPVMLTADKRIVGASFGLLTTEVQQLVPNWRLELDGHLVIALVRSGKKVHLGDLPHIAGALFNDRSDVAEGKAAAVIDFVLKARGLEESEDGYLVEPAPTQ